MATECTVAECERPAIARGYCTSHYARWNRYGDPLVRYRDRYATPEESFAGRAQRAASGCLEWHGSRYPNGYGQISVKGRNVLAHRYAWERSHGPIPEGIQIDHTCFNRACVDVAHLRMATRVQNGRNLQGARRTNRSTGIRGVDIMRGKYIRGRVHVDGKELSRMFPTVEAAAEWVREQRAALYGEFQGRG